MLVAFNGDVIRCLDSVSLVNEVECLGVVLLLYWAGHRQLFPVLHAIGVLLSLDTVNDDFGGWKFNMVRTMLLSNHNATRRGRYSC